MAKKPYNENRLKRDDAVNREYYRLLCKYPNHKHSWIMRNLVEKFFLTERTITAILYGEYERNLKKKLQEQAGDPNQLKLFPDDAA